MELLEHSPVGSEVITRIGDCRPLLAQELNRIFREERIIQTDVVVLGGHSLKNTCIGDDPQVGDYRLVDQPKQFASGDVAYYTYMKFKGCEAKVVILLDIDESDPRWNASGLYTAMSRAVHQLIILKKG